MAVLAAAHVRRFGLDQNRVALAFGFRLLDSGLGWQYARGAGGCAKANPELEVEGRNERRHRTQTVETSANGYSRIPG